MSSLKHTDDSNFLFLPLKTHTALTVPDKDPHILTRNLSTAKTVKETFRTSFGETQQGMTNGFKSRLVYCNRRQRSNCWYFCLPNIPYERERERKKNNQPKQKPQTCLPSNEPTVFDQQSKISSTVGMNMKKQKHKI